MMYIQAGGPCTHYDCNLRNNAGYCKLTACMNEKYNRPADFKAAVEQYRAQHTTNADRIRAMTDEELAEWISCNCTGDGYGNSTGEWLDWLKQEVDNG